MNVGAYWACHSLWLSVVPWFSVPHLLNVDTHQCLYQIQMLIVWTQKHRNWLPSLPSSSFCRRVRWGQGSQNSLKENWKIQTLIYQLHLKFCWMDIVNVSSSGGQECSLPEELNLISAQCNLPTVVHLAAPYGSLPFLFSPLHRSQVSIEGCVLKGCSDFLACFLYC